MKKPSDPLVRGTDPGIRIHIKISRIPNTATYLPVPYLFTVSKNYNFKATREADPALLEHWRAG